MDDEEITKNRREEKSKHTTVDGQSIEEMNEKKEQKSISGERSSSIGNEMPTGRRRRVAGKSRRFCLAGRRKEGRRLCRCVSRTKRLGF